MVFSCSCAPLVLWSTFLFLSCSLNAQSPAKSFESVKFDISYYETFEANKIIPAEIKQPALIALSYFPELKNTSIEFCITKKSVPLTTKPKALSLFRRKSKRKFIIIISNKTTPMLAPILFSNLSYDAQIGVLGHELSHVSDFSGKSFLQLLKVGIGHISGRYIDWMEYKTDSLCINHGLGYQLLSWSEFVRNALCIDQWLGATNYDTYHPQKKEHERYMNPSTIRRIIQEHPIYFHP